MIAIWRSRSYIGLADIFAIDVYSLDGRPTGRIRRDQPARPSTRADIERFKLLDTIGRLATDNIKTVEAWKTMQIGQSDVLGTETDLQTGIKHVKRVEVIRPAERRPVQ